jgi:hypothetical protein
LSPVLLLSNTMTEEGCSSNQFFDGIDTFFYIVSCVIISACICKFHNLC